MHVFKAAIAAGLTTLLVAPSGVAIAGEKAESIDESDPRANDLDTVRCKRMPPPVGSRLGARKVCKTNRAWKGQQENAEDMTRGMQDNSTIGNQKRIG